MKRREALKTMGAMAGAAAGAKFLPGCGDAVPPGIDLLFHGHTHVPRHEVVGHARFLNPGCITRPNRGAPASYAWLDLKKGEPLNWTLTLA